MRASGSACNTAMAARAAKDSVLLLLLCQPRYGSSLIESIIGESPEVLELQEMFNFFAHSPVSSLAKTYFAYHLLGNRSATKEATNAAIASDRAAAVGIAARMARAMRKRAVTFKMFGCDKTASTIFSNYSQDSVAILLERNVFSARVSAIAIHKGCSSFQGRDSTGCKPRIVPSEIEPDLIDYIHRDCCHRAAVGAEPFARVPGLHVARFRYEELDGKRIAEQFALVQRRLRTASAKALAPYRSNGMTARTYHQQDKNHSLSDIRNLGGLQAWYTTEKRNEICRTAMASCRSSPNAKSATEQAMVDWCASNSATQLTHRP